ncbi:unnamed protein product, partial [Ixodes hexagonus]
LQVSFPRSGTHWIQQIVQLIVHKGNSATSFIEFTKRSPFLEIHEVNTTDSPRLLRTHLPIGKLRFSPKAKYIYISRNPWDMSVFNYYLMHGTPAFDFEAATFEEFLDVFLDGQLGFGDFFEHVLSAYKLKDEPNMFFVTYEELHTKKAEVVLRLAYFLGEQYGRRLEENEDAFKEVLEKSTVAFMTDLMRPSFEELAEALGKSPAEFEQLKGSSKSRAPKDKARIIVQGVMGGWKEYFKPETIRKMQAVIDEKSKGLGVMDIWKRV